MEGRVLKGKNATLQRIWRLQALQLPVVKRCAAPGHLSVCISAENFHCDVVKYVEEVAIAEQNGLP